jgi:ferric-dicitrate binding protein FerR (iron transport regulator)
MLRFFKKIAFQQPTPTYQDYSTEDFIADEFFVKWVKSPDEETAHFWDKWISNHPEKAGVISTAKQFIQSVDYREKYELSTAAYTDMYEAIVKKAPLHTNNRAQSTWLFPRNMAAVFAFVLAMATLWLFYGRQPEMTADVTSEPAVELLTRTTRKGEKLSLILPDGTKIKLNANCSLTFPREFEGNSRVIYLEGEAFFDVSEDAKRPFIVHTPQFETRVLGTSFNLCATPGRYEVALVTGSIQVCTASDSLVLQPEQMATIDPEGQVKKDRFDPLTTLGWKDGVLAFKNTRLPTVFAQLEDWYDVQFVFEKGTDLQGKYTGTFENETLENVLRGICATSGMSYQRNAQQKKIYVLNAKPM